MHHSLVGSSRCSICKHVQGHVGHSWRDSRLCDTLNLVRKYGTTLCVCSSVRDETGGILLKTFRYCCEELHGVYQLSTSHMSLHITHHAIHRSGSETRLTK